MNLDLQILNHRSGASWYRLSSPQSASTGCPSLAVDLIRLGHCTPANPNLYERLDRRTLAQARNALVAWGAAGIGPHVS